MSGMTAALEIAEAGYEAVIVEKTGALGGMAAKLWKRQPFKTPYSAAQEVGAGETAAKIAANPLIKVHLNSTIAETSGAPGRFTIKVAQESGTVTEETVGAIVQATGFTTYDMPSCRNSAAASPTWWTRPVSKRLAKQANGGAIKRADGKEIKSVVFVQCAGQRDTTGQHICPTARATAAAPASSRRCTSRTRIPTSTPWSCTRICACRAWARTSTAAPRKRA
jgi:quinone-modifying oxidoreductase subunit QmoB